MIGNFIEKKPSLYVKDELFHNLCFPWALKQLPVSCHMILCFENQVQPKGKWRASNEMIEIAFFPWWWMLLLYTYISYWNSIDKIEISHGTKVSLVLQSVEKETGNISPFLDPWCRPGPCWTISVLGLPKGRWTSIPTGPQAHRTAWALSTMWGGRPRRPRPSIVFNKSCTFLPERSWIDNTCINAKVDATHIGLVVLSAGARLGNTHIGLVDQPSFTVKYAVFSYQIHPFVE